MVSCQNLNYTGLLFIIYFKNMSKSILNYFWDFLAFGLQIDFSKNIIKE